MNNLISVDFHGHTLITVRQRDKVYVAMRSISDAIGLDWKSQYSRLKRDPVLSTCVVMMTTQMPGDDQSREVIFLDINYLNGWLFGIDANRVKPHLRDKVIDYQNQCYIVLARHFRQDAEWELSRQNKELTGMKAAYFDKYPKDREILSKIKSGTPYRVIAKQVKCHPSTVSNAVKRLLHWKLITVEALQQAHRSARIYAATLRKLMAERQLSLSF
jgi:hypothetical protein